MLLLIRFDAAFKGKKTIYPPHQKRCIKADNMQNARFDNKFFRYFSIIFDVFTQVVHFTAFTTTKKLWLFPRKTAFCPFTAFPRGSDLKMRSPHRM